ncbi:hypothetical protein [Chryseobacterium rhizosphaerae]|uniref:hypothetical protein n=1 Tax=Chryseobacterium rhizosphaerae TaxID=395937 RepID=UPI00235A1AED|nr:hypothetical protein [Chryseobacterium rhizosphaerae]MDC8101449.1 hypothetical protein [Chryseobacterium rhizosphaerae]
MKKIRIIAQNPVFILMLLLSFIYVNANKNTIISEQVKTKQKSGEEIFKGLFFLQNDVAENVESLKNIKTQIENSGNSKQSLQNLKELSEESTKFIKEKYPNFFDKLQEAMYSGNLYEIEKYLKESVMLVEQSGLASDRYSGLFTFSNAIKNNETLKNQILSLDLNNSKDLQTLKDVLNDYAVKENIAQLCSLAGAICVFYAVAAAVSIAVAAYSVITKAAYWDPLSESLGSIQPSKQLSKDILVNQLDSYFRG